MDAEAFARDWIAAWNAHDLDTVLSHYEDDVTLTSPRVKLITGGASSTLKGKAALRAYFERALERIPDLKFALEQVYAGEESIVIRFHTNDGRVGAEYMAFSKRWLVCEVRAHYLAGT